MLGKFRRLAQCDGALFIECRQNGELEIHIGKRCTSRPLRRWKVKLIGQGCRSARYRNASGDHEIPALHQEVLVSPIGTANSDGSMMLDCMC